MRAILYPAIALGFFLQLSGPAALAQGTDAAVYDRLDALQRDLKDLQRYVFSGAGGGGAESYGEGEVRRLAADTEHRFSTLDDQLRALTGQLEELNYRLERIGKRIDKLIADVDFRLQAVEQRGGGALAAATPDSPLSDPGMAGTGYIPSEGPGALGAVPEGQVPTGPAVVLPVAALPAGTPEEQYAFAFDQVKKMQRAAGTPSVDGAIRNAEQALKSFLEANPESPRAENAGYWLAEVYYFARDYEMALVTYGRNYESNPAGDKAAANLLKWGMSYIALGENEMACRAFAKLKQEFPGAEVPVKQAAAEASAAAGCS